MSQPTPEQVAAADAIVLDMQARPQHWSVHRDQIAQAINDAVMADRRASQVELAEVIVSRATEMVGEAVKAETEELQRDVEQLARRCDGLQDAVDTQCEAREKAEIAYEGQQKTAPPPISGMELCNRAQLRVTLKPSMAPRTFNNWLARAQANDGFPLPIRTGKRSCSWLVAEVREWIARRPRKGAFFGGRAA